MRDKRRKTPGISLSAAGRHTCLAPGHAGTGKAGTPFWRRTDRHNAPRKAPLWSALSSLLLLWLGVGGTVFAVITGFDLPVGRGAVALSCAAVPAVVWFLALPLRAARLLRLPALLLGAALLASAGENALRGAVLTAQNITQAYHAYFPAVPVWFSDVPMTLENRSAMLDDKRTYVRMRGMVLLACNAQWAGPEQVMEMLERYLAHITDEKAAAARWCVQRLPQFAAACPGCFPRARQALLCADLSRYSESMASLLERDIRAALKRLPEK